MQILLDHETAEKMLTLHFQKEYNNLEVFCDIKHPVVFNQETQRYNLEQMFTEEQWRSLIDKRDRTYNKICWIKLIRALSGCGLAEAKQFVEKYIAP